MNLVTGGAFQEKTEYAVRTFQLEGCETADGADCGREDIFHAALVLRFHEYVRRFMKDEAFLKELPERLLRENPAVVLVADELGCGVVPVDAADRAWREATGRLCCELAKRARQVHRVVCGIGTVIKND